MITLMLMKWSNVFSYGPDNHIDFTTASLLQLIGKNGHGKSSIALILEEVLFNKNSKGIKKSDILNRYSKDKKYSIDLKFMSNSDEYNISTVRGATQTVKLLRNGEDISEHTATATYKLIEEILGFDHKTFTQIVYQTSAYSLEFLTATDTNRKKFLIDLLNLSKYTAACDIFKSISKDIGLQMDSLDAKLSTVRTWLAQFGSADLAKKTELTVPEAKVLENYKVSELLIELANIDTTNKKISQNIKYKEILDGIVLDIVQKPVVDVNALQVELGLLNSAKDKANKIIKGTGPITSSCTYCGQKVDNSHKQVMVDEATTEVARLLPQIALLNDKIKQANKDIVAFNAAQQAQLEWEKYHSLFNSTLPVVVINKASLEDEIASLKKQVLDRHNEIVRINKANTAVIAHNTKIDVIMQQMDTMQKDLVKYTDEYSIVSKRFANLQVLVKTFSTTGLVAYKIECLVKDLEELTNKYLLDMSDGRFQIYFKINASDKLNVIVNDNGNDIDILALSNGERARVNISTLLAIRSLMQSLSNCRINLLILDETVESLDIDGKEKLVEVLLREEHLNTILVSHGFNHPLLERVNVLKEHNISRIE